MTDPRADGHSLEVEPSLAPERDDPGPGEPRAAEGSRSYDALYDAHFDFVWRTLRRLGVPPANVEDATQDVFLVVHRRLGDFEGRSSVRTWLFGIAQRVASTHRRTAARRGADPLAEDMADPDPGPLEGAARAEAVELLHRLLGELDDDRRAVFILAELEQMTAPEIAEATGVTLNTVYSRLRAARRDFDAALARHRARGAGRPT